MFDVQKALPFFNLPPTPPTPFGTFFPYSFEPRMSAIAVFKPVMIWQKIQTDERT
jgi:hypothetical protein